MLLLDTDGTLSGARAGTAGIDRLPMPPQYTLPAVEAEHRLVPNFAALTGLLAAAARNEAEVPSGAYATFDDGLALQQVIDAVRRGGPATEPPGTPCRATPGAGTQK
jgi:hypothetical protein